LGYLKANGLAQSNLYRFAIYFYLHFQYNGFFFFAVMSLFIQLIENKLHSPEINQIKKACYLLLIASLPTYLLSILWANPPLIYNVIGFVSSLIQLIGIFLLVIVLKKVLTDELMFRPSVKFLFTVSASALIAKSILQTISSFPRAVEFANAFRPVVIAYLHLVLIGFVSIFLFGWLTEKKIINNKSFDWLLLFLTSFICSEIILVIIPLYNFHFSHQLLFCFSSLMVIGIALVTISLFKRERGTNMI